MILRRYIDTDREILTGGLELTSPLLDLGTVKRNSTLKLEIQFKAGAVVRELSAGATGILGFKEKAKRDTAAYVAAALTWVKTGSGETSLYTFTLLFSSSPLNTLLKIDADDSNDVASVVLEGEIEWTDSAGIHKTQRVFTLTVVNDIIHGGESFPVPVDTHLPLYLKAITRRTGGITSDLNALATAGVFDEGDLIITRISGFSAYTFDAGAADPLDGGHVAPLDYHAVTNPFHWTQRI